MFTYDTYDTSVNH